MSSPVEMTEMYDTALLGILQHVGNIQDFLQIYFGFLYRKTDFYRLLSGPNDQMGFPPGVAEKMVLKTFKLFEKMAEHNRERQLSELRRRQEESQCVPPPAVQELEIAAEETEEQSSEAAQQAESSSSSSDPVKASAPTSSEATGSSQPDSSSSSSGALGPPSQGAVGGTNPPVEGEGSFQSNPESYNGAVRDNYSWSQDYTDVEVRVVVPKSVIKGRQVSVSLQPSSVRVCVRDGAEEKTLMEGKFTHKINTENSLWSLEPGKCVVVSTRTHAKHTHSQV
ncbi:nudC domain-containing protein 3 [Xyrichtys novacula]|uniref:NudC domain-containing protein 3 n=1 Tax=Xyrichtys novacula TaxID=13765 RepID=A0AAV1G9V7_XYRNO|nr:nudC domain-containing protein 3 [Xyrichtys novacula]